MVMSTEAIFVYFYLSVWLFLENNQNVWKIMKLIEEQEGFQDIIFISACGELKKNRVLTDGIVDFRFLCEDIDNIVCFCQQKLNPGVIYSHLLYSLIG